MKNTQIEKFRRLAYTDLEPHDEGSRMAIEDFILGMLDEENLGDVPPETDWSDWFPPPPRVTEWELCELTDWVEIEASKMDVFADTDTYPLTDYFDMKRLMEKQMIRLNLPVPPAPILEQAVGYSNDRHARFLALWWEPCGDEVMVSDGFVSFTGHWPGYLAYVQHRAVYSYLTAYNLGSSEDPAKFQLVIDLEDRKAFVAPCKEAER